MAIVKWVIALGFLFIMVVFGVKNMEVVTVNLFYNQIIKIPMFLLMALLVLMGAFLAALIGVFEQLKLRARIRGQNKKIKNLEKEISSLKQLQPSVRPEETEEPGRAPV